jgi:antitoxin (DNA-binding transcriptional repressor) of toxin-antitoxin stability system
MASLTMRDFRSNLATSFDRVDRGERVYIRRNSKLYTIVPVEEDDLEITPALAAKIEKARQEHREGKTLRFESAAAAQKWMDEL